MLWWSVLPTAILGSRERHLFGAHLAKGKRLGAFKKLTFVGYLKLSVQKWKCLRHPNTLWMLLHLKQMNP